MNTHTFLCSHTRVHIPSCAYTPTCMHTPPHAHTCAYLTRVHALPCLAVLSRGTTRITRHKEVPNLHVTLGPGHNQHGEGSQPHKHGGCVCTKPTWPQPAMGRQQPVRTTEYSAHAALPEPQHYPSDPYCSVSGPHAALLHREDTQTLPAGDNGHRKAGEGPDPSPRTPAPAHPTNKSCRPTTHQPPGGILGPLPDALSQMGPAGG